MDLLYLVDQLYAIIKLQLNNNNEAEIATLTMSLLLFNSTFSSFDYSKYNS